MGGIYFKTAAWKVFGQCVEALSPSKTFIITDKNTRKHCLPYLLAQAPFLKNAEVVAFPAGEQFKNIETTGHIWRELSLKNADRKSLVINLGGGVVSDLGGFVASTLKRGLAFINIPTSLLAMVDASIGGKNGIDLDGAKNQIGLIKLPEMVVVDPEFLNTLPRPHIVSGLAEMLKHALIDGHSSWERIKNTDFGNLDDVNGQIWDSIKIKHTIVTQDPTEEGLRKTLNYGHTLGHAIESYFLEAPNRKILLHGEAVAIGMVLATYLSAELFGFPAQRLHDITKTVHGLYKKVSFSQEDIDQIINLLIFDKKNRNGQVMFVLLKDLGQPKIDCIVDNELIYKAFDYYKNF